MTRLIALISAVLVAAFFVTGNAYAHSWYSKKSDPVFKTPCCGGTDCATWIIQPGELSAEADGYRVRLTLERTKTINPYSTQPIDALVAWERVQPSEDGNWHLCIMTWSRSPAQSGIYCLFMPPNG
jgi:hypothetical protein